MPYYPLPTKPSVGSPWLELGQAWYDNVAQLITDLPQLRADVTGAQTTATALAASKAPINNPTFTGVVSGVTKAHVGLGDVDNTADAGKQFDASQIVSGVLAPARMPIGVAGIRQRAAVDEATPTATNWGPRPAGYPLVVAIGNPPAPADQQAGDLHVALTPPATGGGGSTPPPETGTTFTLADGSAWPAPWAISKQPAGSVADVQSYEGRLTTASAVGNWQSDDMIAARHQVPAANLDITFSYRPVTAGVTANFILRSDNANLDPANGVAVSLSGSTLKITQIIGWTYTGIGSVAKTWATGSDYRVRVSAQGTTVRAKQWAGSASEPTGWDVIATTSVTATGSFGFAVSPGGPKAAYTAAFDNITLA